MKVDKNKVIVCLCSLSLVFALWAGQEKPQKKKTEIKDQKSLIHKELLLKTKKKLTPPRRNIFSLRRGGGVETRIVPVIPQTNSQRAARAAEERSSALPMNIRYIGHIRSGNRIVALIIFEGAPLAVEKGEMISEGIQIGDVTPAFIEIVGPDSVKRKYALEGEKE